MLNVLILFERPDIAAVNYLQSQFQDSEVWVFDPHLLDDLATADIKNCKYINLNSIKKYSEFNILMRQEALSIEKEINCILNSNSKINEYHNLHTLNWEHLHTSLKGYSLLWDNLLNLDLTDHIFHLPIYDRAAYYYLPSFIPAIILYEKMTQNNISVKAYIHTTTEEKFRLLPTISTSTKINEFEIFVHLPTCFYDSEHFQTELILNNKKLINFSSQDWNINLPLLEPTVLQEDNSIYAQFDSELQLEISNQINLLELLIYNYLKKFFRIENFLLRQVKSISLRYRASIIFINYLNSICSISTPNAIVLSSHDAGLHSAFYFIAEKYNIKIIILPHSKSINWPVESNHCNKILALHHPIQSDDVLNIHQKNIESRKVIFPTDFKIPYKKNSTLRIIGIILNKFSNDGISYIDTDDYLSGLKEIIEWSKDNNKIIKFRLKPGGTCIKWLSLNLEISPQDLISNISTSISDFANETDICIMYDAPTSGAIEILRNGTPLLGIKFRELTKMESSIVCDKLVPYMTTQNALQLLTKFSNYNDIFHDFKYNQVINYITQNRSAKSINTYLN